MVSGRSGKGECGGGVDNLFFFFFSLVAVNQTALPGESVAEEEVAAVVGKEMREEEGEKYSWRAIPTSVMAR